MLEKINSILHSIRFWQIVVAFGLLFLVEVQVIDGSTYVALAETISTILGVSVTIGSVDSVAKKMGNKE